MKKKPHSSNGDTPLVYSDVEKILRREDPLSPLGAASDYIEDIDDLLSQDTCLRVVIFCRVSRREQDRTGNLQKQIAWVRAWLWTHNVVVLAVVWDVASGWKEERVEFKRAVQLAKKCGAVVVAESMDRFIRSRKFNTKTARDAWPTEHEFASLKEDADGVTLATIFHPNEKWEVVHRHQTIRGYGLRCVAGEKKFRRQAKFAQVIWLWVAWGFTYREIQDEVGICFSTVRDWIARYCSGCAEFAPPLGNSAQRLVKYMPLFAST